jgi:hypothetical protein
MLGTVSIGNGCRQVTYAGNPLYGYAQNTGLGTGYVGTPEFGGSWDAVSATGKAVR